MRSYSLVKVAAWCFYDWACASFSVIVTTFVFATYFTTKVAENHILGTYQWANAEALAGIIIAFASPLVGAIADYCGQYKQWLLFFTLISLLSAAGLWFAYPTPSAVNITLLCVVVGTIALELAIVFYNALLPHLAPLAYLGRISGIGWGWGYFGGIVALSVALFVFIKWNLLGLNSHTSAQIRICGPFVAIWYGLFSLPLFIVNIPINTAQPKPLMQAVRHGVSELFNTLKKVFHEKNIFLYLLAHMIYTDGLNTLFVFGGIYAAGTFGLSFEEVLLFGISMNVTAGLGAIALGWMDDYLGSKATILLSLVCLILFGIPLLILQDKTWFWGVALLLCLFVGPVQSASRSLMVRLLINKEKSAEMFGLYALSGRVSSFLGPWMLGVGTLYFGTQRVGMATILIFFAIGAFMMVWVREKIL